MTDSNLFNSVAHESGTRVGELTTVRSSNQAGVWFSATFGEATAEENTALVKPAALHEPYNQTHTIDLPRIRLCNCNVIHRNVFPQYEIRVI